ncbi:tetratricopeptide (TPR) repeat protein [Sphingobium jiangsuense]|uniref:Tetratricopeptide (TPR) repeat protein n=2 Tax=Sphingobium jiangsuense TaxID=870476 RepID=A0A7W6BSM9_9SPHN|nr:tetratricopeptide repeat protein [Sphingobium jiangsuense]MBB3927114.1 tetratricopeptide (TPR) repeat protein [Sphingobium jiangsuense]
MASRFRGRFSRFVLVLLSGGLALAAVPVSPVHADARADARAAMQRGQAAILRGDPRAARVELMNAIKADPQLAEARVLQARALLMLGDGRGGQQELERAQALGTKAGPIRHLLAHAALLQGRYDEALAQATAKDADPREAPFLARMEGQALQALGRYDEAVAALARAERLAPKDGAVRADSARLHLATGNMAAALRAGDEALALAPRNADVLLLRALLVREQYGPEASRTWFDQALGVSPSYVPALIEYAATLADLGQASQALALTRRALAQAPGYPRAYYIQALIAARAGAYDLARGLLDRTGGALDGVAGMRLLRGVLHLESHNATLAAGQLAPLLESQPLNVRVRLLLARAYYDDAQYAEAERTLFPLVERADAGSYALTLAAYIHEALGNRPLAADFARRAARLAAGSSDVYRGAGRPEEVAAAANADPARAGPNLRYIRALLEAGQGNAAIARARTLSAANPGAPAASLALGDSLMAAERYHEAALAYARSANIRFRQDNALRLADAWRRAGETESAERALGLFVAQNPMDVEGQRLVASLLLAAGEHDRAWRLLSVLRARLGNRDALLMTDMARALVGLRQPERALPYAAHAYRLQPMSAVTSDIFGWTLLRAGRSRAQARELLEKARSLAPGEPLVQWHLGQLYAAAGEKDLARAALSAAAGAPGFPERAEAKAALEAL